MNDDLNNWLELIDSVKATNIGGEIELIGSKKAFGELVQMGFDLNSVRHHEIEFDDSRIFVIPLKPQPIKVYFEGEDEKYQIN